MKGRLKNVQVKELRSFSYRRPHYLPQLPPGVLPRLLPEPPGRLSESVWTPSALQKQNGPRGDSRLSQWRRHQNRKDPRSFSPLFFFFISKGILGHH